LRFFLGVPVGAVCRPACQKIDWPDPLFLRLRVATEDVLAGRQERTNQFVSVVAQGNLRKKGALMGVNAKQLCGVIVEGEDKAERWGEGEN